MEIFISEKFIDDFDQQDKFAYANHLTNSVKTINKIRDLLLSGLTITCNIEKTDLVKSFDNSGNKNYSNFKDVFSASFIKSGKYNFLSLEKYKEIINYNAYYFLELDIDAHNSHGIVNVNDISNATHFYENCTVNSRSLSSDYTLIEEAAPPCNAMLYVDMYIFSSKKKIDNFVKFISIYLNESLTFPFHLSIISSYEENNKTIPADSLNYAEVELNKINNLLFEILLDKSKHISSELAKNDRLIFTNYTMGNIGHPFDDRLTIFNQNFLGTSSNIKSTYEDFISNLKKWSDFINKVPQNLGYIKTKYFNVSFKNRLLNDL